MAIVKYGRRFETNSHLEVELWAFRERLSVQQGGLGGAKHFERVCRELWPEFTWYEDAYEQAEIICNNDVTAFTAGASHSKSDILGKFGLVSWFANPMNTLVIVCSTSSLDAKQRIWGHIVRDFRRAASQNKSVGKLIETQAIIKLSEKTDGEAASDNSSISLIAAGDEHKAEAIKKLQGRKNKHIIAILDELQNCSQDIIDEALWNLNANPKWEVHAAGNAASRHDAHGVLMSPMEGWQSVNRYTHKWKIKAGGKVGVGVHFDSTADNSPNISRFHQGLPQLPFLRKAEDIMIARQDLGEQNTRFLRQYVGFWPEAEGETNYIMTDAALASHGAYDTLGNGFAWQSSPLDILGIDPSYSSGGDRFIAMHLQWGLCTDKVWRLYFKEAINVKAMPAPGETRDYAAIRECKKIAADRSISPTHVGMDSSAGTALLSIAHREWSSDILAVPFGGSATDLPISVFDRRAASDVYSNRTSELAYVLVEFLNNGQVRGVRPEHAKELVARKYELVAGGKIRIEKKADLKKRLGFSPDIADAGAVALATLRERVKVQAGADAPRSLGEMSQTSALEFKKRMDVAGRSLMARRGAQFNR